MKKITNLYEYYKNTPKKLKIICDWDEVIQACEPYALWKVFEKDDEFTECFEDFWKRKCIKYSHYGSKLSNEIVGEENIGKYHANWSISDINPNFLETQQEIKNSLDFYQQAPFLTIVEDLLKLIKERKAQVIFLSTYDKRKFPNGDERKKQIFAETFGKLNSNNLPINFAEMRLVPFDSETQGQTKADWIKENASDFDIFYYLNLESNEALNP